MVNNTSGFITLDHDKRGFELNYSTYDMLKDSTGKICLKLDNKHFKRTNDSIALNIVDSMKYDVTTNKLSSNINKYLITTGDIYLDSNNKLKINMNNYVVDNAGTVIMDTNT